MCRKMLILAVLSGAIVPIGKATAFEMPLFSDDFESYPVGTFPSAGGWEIVWGGTGQNYVIDAYSFSPTRSFQLWGRPSWASVAQKKFSTDSSVIGYEFAICIDSIGTPGPGAVEHSGFFNREAYIWGAYYALAKFNHNDGRIWAEDGTILGGWEPGVWYQVKVLLDRSTNSYDVWIDGELRGEGLSTTRSDTHLIDALALVSAHAGVKVYYDDVRVFEISPPILEKEITSGPMSASAPECITFEILNTCGADPQQFFLNGVSLGTVLSNPANSCTCSATLQTFAVTDPAMLAAWNIGGENSLRYVKSDHGTAFAWLRARVEGGCTSETVCIFDHAGGNCDVMNLCSAGYTFSPVDQTTTFSDPGFVSIDVVVEVGKGSTTEYDFDITYVNLGGPEVLVVDTVPAEWVVTNVAGNLIVDGFSGGRQPDGNGGTGTVEVFPVNRQNPSKSATKIHWWPDPTLASTINVVAETRESPGMKNVKFAPTSCGPLYLNEDGAAAFEVDPETGEPLRDPETGDKLAPILVSNPLCLAAVEDCNGDGVIAKDGSGDEDGDSLTDFGEACVIGTDPCNPDTDRDGVLDGVDQDPLDPEVF
jgi:hypothetical protein